MQSREELDRLMGILANPNSSDDDKLNASESLISANGEILGNNPYINKQYKEKIVSNENQEEAPIEIGQELYILGIDFDTVDDNRESELITVLMECATEDELTEAIKELETEVATGQGGNVLGYVTYKAVKLAEKEFDAPRRN